MKINYIDYEYCITDERSWINHKIDNDIETEECQWIIENREDLVDELIDWISDISSNTDRNLMKNLMKKDLKYLINLDDDYIFSSTTTNEYVAKSDNEKVFNDLCNDFIIYKWIWIKQFIS